jgi:hypothetical protein
MVIKDKIQTDNFINVMIFGFSSGAIVYVKRWMESLDKALKSQSI